MSLLTSGGAANIGLLGKQTAPQQMGYVSKIVLVPTDFEFDTKDLALTETNWLDKINARSSERAIILPLHREIENTPEETAYDTSSLGYKSFLKEGKDTTIYSIETTPFVMSQLRTLNGVDWKLYEITSEGFIKGTSRDEIKFLPFTIDSFRVEKPKQASATEVAVVPVSITLKDPTEWADRPAFLEPLKDGLPETWNPRDLLASTLTGSP